MVDRVVVVAGVVVGGDDVEAVLPLGVAGVGVDVADLLALEELAGEGPGVAVVVGDQRAGVVVDRADEAVEPSIELVEVGVGDVAALGELGPVEHLLLAPAGGVVRLADPPVGVVVGLVAGVDGEPAPVGAQPEGRHVVVVGLEALVQRHDLHVPGLEVHDGEVEVAAATLPVLPGDGGDGADDELPPLGVDEGALVLEPAPGAVGVQDLRDGLGGHRGSSEEEGGLPGRRGSAASGAAGADGPTS